MKTILRIAVVCAVALSLVAGVASTTTRAGITICAFVSCDYNKERVRLMCVKDTPKKTLTYYTWTYDPDYWERYCESP
jgi:hypothetical protein